MYIKFIGGRIISLIFFSDLMHLQKLIRNECFGYTFVLFSFYIVIPSTFNMLGLFVHTHAPSSCRSYNPPRETNPNKYTKNTAHRKRRKFKKIILILDQNRSKLQDRRSEGEEENRKKKFEIPSKKRHQDRTSSSLLSLEEGEEEKWRTAGIRIF